jgi:hypothetical protein
VIQAGIKTLKQQAGVTEKMAQTTATTATTADCSETQR